MAAEKRLVKSTPFEVEFVLERMRSTSGNDQLVSQNLKDIDVVDITGGSAFLARVLKVTFEWNDSTIEPKSVVLKLVIHPNHLTFTEE
uniref:Calcyclin-binding protein n=1 Tax=Steinernema glaseri TaxID=37863 RepID=A0A1I7ZA94_9BILA